MWPALVVTALVTGIVGGLLGGALVLGTGLHGADTFPVVGGARPLPADNGSVAAAAAKALPSTVQVKVLNGHGKDVSGATGSGFVVDRQGHVITNAHVVEVLQAGGHITVVDDKGRTHTAQVVGDSPVYDVAVLKVSSPQGLQPVAVGSAKTMRVGETVLVVGSPLGLTRSVTSGIVSALDRPVTTGSTPDASAYIDAVQTDAAINPGSSGGPLVNLRGQVVGMNSAIATTGTPVGSEPGNIGVGFAIPIDQVRLTARQILATGKAEYPVIGAQIQTNQLSQGATVVGVPSGTPAAAAGLRKGDRIIAIDGKRVPDGVSLIVAIRTHQPGDVVDLTVVRNGTQQTVHVRLDAKVG
jgi:putative serine protease PepD